MWRHDDGESEQLGPNGRPEAADLNVLGSDLLTQREEEVGPMGKSLIFGGKWHEEQTEQGKRRSEDMGVCGKKEGIGREMKLDKGNAWKDVDPNQGYHRRNISNLDVGCSRIYSRSPSLMPQLNDQT